MNLFWFLNAWVSLLKTMMVSLSAWWQKVPRKKCSSFLTMEGKTFIPLDRRCSGGFSEVAQLNEQSAFSVSAKSELNENDVFSAEDESDMILTISFDLTKPHQQHPLSRLWYGVTTKIWLETMDKETQAVCSGLDGDLHPTWSDIYTTSTKIWLRAVERQWSFYKVIPRPKGTNYPADGQR